jgi:hypothetical protein
MDHAAQEGAGREDDCAAGHHPAVRELNSRDGVGVGPDARGFPLDDSQV